MKDLVIADFKSIEPVVLASVSGCKRLLGSPIKPKPSRSTECAIDVLMRRLVKHQIVSLVWGEVEHPVNSQVRYQLGDLICDLMWRWRDLDVQGYVE